MILATHPPSAAIFLDIDDVVTYAPNVIDPAKVARLDALCRLAGARVVVVSARRPRHPGASLAAHLRGAGLTAPVEVLPPQGDGRDQRAMETLAWLDAHPEVTRWVILDDTRAHWHSVALASGFVVTGPEASAHRRLRGKLVEVDGARGLTDADVERAARILGVASTTPNYP